MKRTRGPGTPNTKGKRPRRPAPLEEAGTVDDWLADARAAKSSTRAERALASARALASSVYEWRAILAVLVELERAPRALVVEAADRTLELSHGEREVWGFLDAAAARKTRLGDAAGARAALEACKRSLLEPQSDLLGRDGPARGYEWVLLARGFARILGDDAAVKRCLDAGIEAARRRHDADDLCSLGVAWGQLVEREAGKALLLEAERMGDAAAHAWSLANSWKELGDEAAVRRVLDGALAQARSLGPALQVVRAWASHHELEAAREALRRACALATTAAHWLAIGKTARDAGLGQEAIRDALTRAEGLAQGDEPMAALASAFKLWLDDDVAAARLGPRGVRPEALGDGAMGSASALFDWLRARVSDEVLERIARADYGADADKHLRALRDIRDSGLIPRRLPWEPHEVLALTRWSEGRNVDHLARGFSCLLLCLAPDASDELVTNGPILAQSCLALGEEARERAEQFFAWRSSAAAKGFPEGEDAIALLLLLILRAAAAAPDIGTVATTLLDHPIHPPETLAEWMTDSMRADLWKSLLSKTLGRSGEPEVARLVERLGG
jgi:hypothetical protein